MKRRTTTKQFVTLTLALALCTFTAALAHAAEVSEAGIGGAINHRNCATPDATPEQMTAVVQAVESFRKSHPFETMAVGGQIKVAWHVIYNGSTGNVPQSQIDAQIAYMNKAYAGFYGGANTGYTFVLASVDRTDNRQWFTMTPGSSKERNAKQALATDVIHRLNIYSCALGQNLLGWAYFPNSYAESDWHHGVVFHYGSVPGGYLAPYNLGGTLAHEVGHYLGLYHTFQGGCVAPGDQVSDTPDEGTATSGCPVGKNTCATAGNDPIENYMDYSDDACYTTWTAGQDVRMDGIVPVYRPNLLNAALVAGGGNITVGGGTTELARSASAIGGAQLSFRGAFPNPFSRTATLHFALPKSGNVSLKVFDVAGELVQTLVDGERPAGEQNVSLRGAQMRPGMYFATLRYNDQSITRSIVLIP